MTDSSKIWASSQLPTLPSVAVELLELSNDPATELPMVVQVIKTDPAIAAKILKVTNSSYYGFKKEVTTLERAVSLLGTRAVTSLALSFSLVDAATSTGKLADHFQAYWRQSVVQGLAAEVLGQEFHNPKEHDFFLAGLLADLGRLAMLKTIGPEYTSTLETMMERQSWLAEQERDDLGFDHVEIGTKLMENWKLPPALIEASRFHHRSLDEIREHTNEVTASPVQCVATAAAIGDYYCMENQGPALERVRELANSFYQLESNQLQELLTTIKSRIDHAAELFNVDPTIIRAPNELLAMANEQLARLAVQERLEHVESMEEHKRLERETQRLKAVNQELQKRILHDPLTKIYNRAYLEDALRRETDRCCRLAEAIGLVFIDVDKFKNLNDTHGHAFGDVVLQRVARTMQKTLRGADILARYGGEEFVALVMNPSPEGIQIVAERLRTAVEREIIELNNTRVPVTVSLGCALGIPGREDDEFTKQLIEAADHAMYEAKSNGRNQSRFINLLPTADQHLLNRINELRFSEWLVTGNHIAREVIDPICKTIPQQHQLIGQLARKHGYLSNAEVRLILDEQQATEERFGETAIRRGLISLDVLANLLAWQQEDPETLLHHLERNRIGGRDDYRQLLGDYLDQSPIHEPLSAIPA
ncbi:sensor domain-containing diguanylate cyclase [Thalassoroseus pseudoceratinae]|uniref:sensor domain-containing diguanylate cyclase n=1 Tax=Thalassoroseus pseudoceratinae TaxID=2713176 RepID=UPI00141F439E|nr:GGDEF domain-containing protein [Thalassoroseus pseudoceratinae]